MAPASVSQHLLLPLPVHLHLIQTLLQNHRVQLLDLLILLVGQLILLDLLVLLDNARHLLLLLCASTTTTKIHAWQWCHARRRWWCTMSNMDRCHARRW
jgi:hypothetical protein